MPRVVDTRNRRRQWVGLMLMLMTMNLPHIYAHSFSLDDIIFSVWKTCHLKEPTCSKD